LQGLRRVDLSRSQKREARNLAATVLTAIARHWDQERQPLPPSLLEHWYALKEWASGPIQSPQIGLTWTELYPASPSGQLDRPELVRIDEWLALAQTLWVYAPETLSALGFFERDRELLKRLAETLETTTDQATRAVAESILTRIQELAPGPAYLAARNALSAIEHESSSDDQWWIPEDIPIPPSDDPVPSEPVEFNREDIGRVLSDL
jgi:hypothetical protein